MGRPSGWVKEFSGRSALKSPGAPSHRKEVQKLFWLEIAKGLTSEEAAVRVEAAPVLGSRWFRQSGGMSSLDLTPLSGRYLSFPEREEIALLRVQGKGVCGARSLASSSAARQQSRVSCEGTPPPAAVASIIEPSGPC